MPAAEGEVDGLPLGTFADEEGGDFGFEVACGGCQLGFEAMRGRKRTVDDMSVEGCRRGVRDSLLAGMSYAKRVERRTAHARHYQSSTESLLLRSFEQRSARVLLDRLDCDASVKSLDAARKRRRASR